MIGQLPWFLYQTLHQFRPDRVSAHGASIGLLRRRPLAPYWATSLAACTRLRGAVKRRRSARRKPNFLTRTASQPPFTGRIRSCCLGNPYTTLPILPSYDLIVLEDWRLCQNLRQQTLFDLTEKARIRVRILGNFNTQVLYTLPQSIIPSR